MERAVLEVAARLLREAPARARPLAGGDVCLAFRIELRSGRALFAKSPRTPQPGMLACEAEGLRWLAEAGALRVPEVVGMAEAEDGAPALLILKWIESGVAGPGFEAALGRGLAALHAAGAPAFGFVRDNWIGPLPQPNRARPTWPRFYAEQRLAPLLARARAERRLAPAVAARAERLLARMEQLVGPAEPPARLHGDLWRGNVLADDAGAPVLVDPAVYGGHREVDLAMMRLFGGFGADCFRAYARAAPLADGHEARVALYQLYPLLVHVSLFGVSYASAFEDALARCERAD